MRRKVSCPHFLGERPVIMARVDPSTSSVGSMRAFVERLLEHPSLGPMVVHHQRLDGTPPRFAEPAQPLDPDLAEALRRHGIERLYTHQAHGLDLTRSGSDLLLVTPTASGKTLLFATSVLESLRRDPRSKALFLYPTKALARDQLAGFRSLAEHHAWIGDVRGLGLFMGVELVRDRETLEPASAETACLIELVKADGILLSAEGPHHNVLKIKPPLAFEETDADLLLGAVDRALRSMGAPAGRA